MDRNRIEANLIILILRLGPLNKLSKIFVLGRNRSFPKTKLDYLIILCEKCWNRLLGKVYVTLIFRLYSLFHKGSSSYLILLVEGFLFTSSNYFSESPVHLHMNLELKFGCFLKFNEKNERKKAEYEKFHDEKN